MTKQNLKQLFLGVALVIWLTAGGQSAQALPAFPGAEGFGSETPGGRGGVVLEVTNLNDSGPGSLREALAVSSPRTIVFRTGGTIDLQTDLRIRAPFVTVAGQTAPGGGVQLKGKTLQIETHDVVIRNLRMRLGKGSTCCADSVNVQTHIEMPYNILIDHCSMSWGADETFSTWQAIHDLTVQWSFITEALLKSSDTDVSHAVLIGTGASNVSLHHNLFANNKGRNPRINPGATAEIVNNLVYNWRWYGARTSSKANIIGNRFITGPNWTGGHGITIEASDLGSDKVYVKDNLGPYRVSSSQDDWLEVMGDDAQSHRSAVPVFPLSNVTVHDAAEVRDLVLEHAGALPHDTADIRVANDVRNGTGDHIYHEDEVGGFPLLAPGTPSTDRDGDGMPDDWETAHGLNPDNPADGTADADGNGYTNVEEYLNSLIPATGEATPSPPTGLSAE